MASLPSSIAFLERSPLAFVVALHLQRLLYHRTFPGPCSAFCHLQYSLASPGGRGLLGDEATSAFQAFKKLKWSSGPFKARWIKACTVGSGIETICTCHGYNYLTVSTVSSLYGVVVALDIVFTSENIKQSKKTSPKSTQTRKQKSLKMKRDVGMAWQKITQTREDIKVKVNIQYLWSYKQEVSKVFVKFQAGLKLLCTHRNCQAFLSSLSGPPLNALITTCQLNIPEWIPLPYKMCFINCN